MEKKIVTRTEEIDYSNLEGTFDGVIEYLQRKKKDYPEGASLDIYVEGEYGSHDVRVDVVWKEEETDWECKNREAREANQKEWRRKQFEILKKEFD